MIAQNEDISTEDWGKFKQKLSKSLEKKYKNLCDPKGFNNLGPDDPLNRHARIKEELQDVLVTEVQKVLAMHSNCPIYAGSRQVGVPNSQGPEAVLTSLLPGLLINTLLWAASEGIDKRFKYVGVRYWTLNAIRHYIKHAEKGLKHEHTVPRTLIKCALLHQSNPPPIQTICNLIRVAGLATVMLTEEATHIDKAFKDIHPGWCDILKHCRDGSNWDPHSNLKLILSRYRYKSVCNVVGNKLKIYDIFQNSPKEVQF